MSMMESVAYLKGLAKGLDVSDDTKEGKLLIAMIDVLDEIASSVSDVEEMCDELDELVGIIDEDLGNVEEEIYDVHHHHAHDCCGDESILYEVTCPKCDTQLEFDLNDITDSYYDDDDFDCGCDDDCGCGCHDDGDCSCGDDCACTSSSLDE